MTSKVAAAVLAVLTDRGETVATAESLTGGLLCAALVDIAGASAAVRGGVVAYDAWSKAAMLDVDAGLLERRGTVDVEVAGAMAAGVRRRFGATWGVSTTGVAGPEPADGKPVGTVCLAVAGPEIALTEQLALAGERDEIRRATTDAALSLLLATLEEQTTRRDG